MPVAKRERYLEDLVHYQGDGTVKVITGIRRCGKTFLLFDLFREHLRAQGVPDDHVIAVRLDREADAPLRDPHELHTHVFDRIVDDRPHYVLIDEVQNAIAPQEFRDITLASPRLYGVLNGFAAEPNLDVYVTGSNSRFLSTDTMTEFRGRGTEIRLHPLSFAEVMGALGGNEDRRVRDYLIYGGMPRAVLEEDAARRERYLRDLFEGTYRKDIVERYRVRKVREMDALVTFLASNVGSLTNPVRIADGLARSMGSDVSRATVIAYLSHLAESFIIDEVPRSDLRGREVLKGLAKYYFEDVGLRNARLGFPAADPGHQMENVVYNELRIRGLDARVGRILARERQGDRSVRKEYECDFVASGPGIGRAYIQCAWTLGDEAKLAPEKASLLRIRDAFPKFLVVGDAWERRRDEDGIIVMGLVDFLLDPDSLRG